jgi:signal transduction histidine kinase
MMPRALADRLPAWAKHLRLPPRTVRLRLTLLYGGLFLICGAGLLATTYVLVDHAISGHISYTYYGPHGATVVGCMTKPDAQTGASHPSGGSGTAATQLAAAGQRCMALALHQQASDLHALLVYSGIALAIMAVLSVALGWIVAGRVLRPLRTMRMTTQRITEQNLHERLALAGPRDELKDLSDTIDDLLGRLEEAFEAQRRFVANASHELRTPLTMMRTALDVTAGKPGPQPPQVTVLATKIRKGLDRADRLVDSFLTLARLQNGSRPGDAVVSLGQTASSALAERSRAIAATDLRVVQDLPDVAVQGSEVLLAHMTENLIDNAIRHNEPGGWVRVTTRADGSLARLVVETGGRVLDDREVRDLAQPFRRLGADRTGSANGTGLGLSIVAAVATSHNGTLDLHARAGGGLRAVITLPAVAEAAMAGLPA